MPEKDALWVVLPHWNDSALGLLCKAYRLSREQNRQCAAIFVAPELPADISLQIGQAGADIILHIPCPALSCDYEVPVRDAIVALAEKALPSAIVFLSSVFFCAVAPGVAVRLCAGITADCTQLSWDDEGKLLQVRPTFGGRFLATIAPCTAPAIATVRPGVFPAEIPCPGKQAAQACLPPVVREDFVLTQTPKESAAPLNLHDARILLVGGAGIGSAEKFQKLYVLAKKLGAEVGASRAAVAAGYAPYDRQIGQTGITVNPDYYIAFGISGAVQHLCGMIGAKTIIAVNPDPNAPIHKHSNYSVYADADCVIDEMLSQLQAEN